jgi:L-histidine N-alpha-methyltransferase
MPLTLIDLEPATADEQAEILAGLQREPKQIAPKFFYDSAGSRLFDLICEQPEYYPTRTELRIIRDCINEIADLLGPEAALIEFGSGSSLKTRLLLDNMTRPAAYVPVDISRQQLISSSTGLAEDYPCLEVLAVCADFTQPFQIPETSITPQRNVVFFPGSTIGNFSRGEAVDLMRVMRSASSDNGALLIGVDLIKEKDVLEPAYNDAAGVTADFNLNLLTRLNREHGANFSVENFQHSAIFDEANSRIEMRLVSLEKQQSNLAGHTLDFAPGEHIVTEHSHKYSIAEFESMANAAGFAKKAEWTDEKELFSVQYFLAA